MTPRLHPDFLTMPLAHRALHDVADGRPENSRAAVTAAIDAGFGIEIDLQLSSDEQAMVFHDYDLARLAEADGTVQQRDAATLAGIRLRGGEEGIPTLPEILSLVAGQVPLLIELKDQQGQMGQTDGILEQATAEALKSYQGPVAVMSFNPNSVMQMAELAPDVPRGIVTSSYAPDDWPLPVAICDRLRDIPDYDASLSSFISHELDDLSRPRVAALKEAGADVLCWTVKSPQDAAEALKVAQNITFEGYLPT